MRKAIQGNHVAERAIQEREKAQCQEVVLITKEIQ